MLICIFLSGCWNRRELNELGIVIATAIDLDENNKWITTFQVVVPGAIGTQTSGGSGQSPVSVFSTKGDTLEHAFQNSNTEAPRSLFFAHNRVVIISESVAKEGVDQILDFYLRNIESRETMNIILTKRNPSELLEVLIPLEKVPGNAISNMLKGVEKNLSLFKKIKLQDFIIAMTSPSAIAILPEVKVSGDLENQKTLDALQKTRSGAVLKLGDVGIFKRHKLAGWLNEQESIGLSWITNNIDNAIISFPCNVPNKSEQMSSFRVQKGSTKLRPKWSNGKLEITVDIKAKGTLSETACRINIKHPKTIAKLENQIQEKIKTDVMNTFEAAKKMKVDVLGFGNRFHKEYPEKWKELQGDWNDETFSDIIMYVTIDVEIDRTGMVSDPLSKVAPY